MKVTLSPRLNQIDRMITKSYDHIWDCCCDHGLLGRALLHRRAGKVIHFIDRVPALVAGVEQQLEIDHAELDPSNFNTSQWQTHCIDVANLVLPADKHQAENKSANQQASQLIIIAGVGGDLLIKFVRAILANNPRHSLEFLLCPVYHQYKVRCALIDLNLQLKAEHLLQDNNRFYEILHITTPNLSSGAPEKTDSISPVGLTMWNFNLPEHREYHQRILDHYGRMTKRQDSNIDTKSVLAMYRALY